MFSDFAKRFFPMATDLLKLAPLHSRVDRPKFIFKQWIRLSGILCCSVHFAAPQVVFAGCGAVKYAVMYSLSSERSPTFVTLMK